MLRKITPRRFPVAAVLATVIRLILRIIWRNLAKRRRACVPRYLFPAKST
jgi:hypothetical protein